nr:ROK family protein [Acidimicrobiia bacterium]
EAAFAAAAAGDERAAAAIAVVVDHIGLGLANMVTVLMPERIVIGGGMAEAGGALIDAIAAAVRRHCVLVPAEWYEVVPAVLGVHAGAIGAALWAADRGGSPRVDPWPTM